MKAPGVAEDVAAETWLQVVRDLARFRGDADVIKCGRVSRGSVGRGTGCRGAEPWVLRRRCVPADSISLPPDV